MAYNYKFINDENYVEKQDELNEKLLTTDYGENDLTEEEVELMLFTIRIEHKNYGLKTKWQLFIDYIKYNIYCELNNDISGELAPVTAEWLKILDFNKDKFDEKQEELNNYMLNEWRAKGYEPNEFTEEQREVMRFVLEKEIDTTYFFDWDLVVCYLKTMIETYLHDDEEGENVLNLIKWVNLYADYWGVE